MVNIGFEHGIYSTELPTTIVPLTNIANPAVVIGTAPIHLASEPAPSNVPILVSSMSEFVQQFGYSDDFESFTLCEAAKCFFSLYNVEPLICINVLDSSKHAKSVTHEITSVTPEVVIEGNLLNDTILISTGNDDTYATLEAGKDYTAAYDSDGNTVLTIKNMSKVVDGVIFVTARELDPEAVTSKTIVGGADLATGKNTGLEVIEDVYPRLGVVPGTIIAPKFSCDAEVALVMASKAKLINGCFKSLAVCDLPTSSVKKYTDVTSAKSGSNFVDEFLVVCWPKVKLGSDIYHMSTQLAALMCVVDSERDGLSYKSPSNEFLKCDSSVLADGTEVYLGKNLANYLNGQGVATALNFGGGFRSWCVYTSLYPSSTDPKNFIAVRRFWNWINNELMLNFFSKIDSPQNRVLIDSVLDSVRIWLNGLASRGALLSGSDIAFLSEDNPQTELLAGHLVFRMNLGFVVPAVKITFVTQLDPSLLSSLFSTTG